jgi:NDP-sugar pyrophosphorylase family protein
MTERTPTTYPVFVMCGRDAKRRKLLEVLDPEGKYKAKALMPFLGKRLIDWQLEELRQSPYVADLYLVGLAEEDAAFDFPVHYIPVETTADFADKLTAGVNYLDAQGVHPELVVISSSDAPGIRVGEINAFFEGLAACNNAEFVLSLVLEAVIEAEFPGSGRVVARFRDCQVIPGELYALSPRAIRIGEKVIREFSQRRRQINRQKQKISLGPMLRYLAKRPGTWGLLVKYALGTATLADAERGFSAAFGCPTKGVIILDAGFGMDMDLPEDYEKLEEFVRRTKGDGGEKVK